MNPLARLHRGHGKWEGAHPSPVWAACCGTLRLRTAAGTLSQPATTTQGGKSHLLHGWCGEKCRTVGGRPGVQGDAARGALAAAGAADGHARPAPQLHVHTRMPRPHTRTGIRAPLMIHSHWRVAPLKGGRSHCTSGRLSRVLARYPVDTAPPLSVGCGVCVDPSTRQHCQNQPHFFRAPSAPVLSGTAAGRVKPGSENLPIRGPPPGPEVVSRQCNDEHLYGLLHASVDRMLAGASPYVWG